MSTVERIFFLEEEQDLTSCDITGLVSFLVLRMWFGKAVDDFNEQIQQEGSDAPQLVATIQNGFISESASLSHSFDERVD